MLPLSSPRRFLALATVLGGACALIAVGWALRTYFAPATDDTSASTAPAIGSGLVDPFVREGVWSQIAADNHIVMHAPTPPPRAPRLALPWEPHQAVLLAVQLPQVTTEPGLATLYRDFLLAVLPVTRVQVLFHRRERSLVPTWIRQLSTVPDLVPLLDKIEFVPAEIDSMWIRDFGPFFGVDRAKRLLVYDTAYLDPRIEISNYLTTEAMAPGQDRDRERSVLTAELERIRGADISPSIFASHLVVDQRVPTLLVRPPLVLAGGDLLPIATDTVLISQSTLEANGGRSDFLETRLQQYLGANHVHYLQPLPGETIQHIDFLVQAISANTLLVATPTDFDDRGHTGLKLLRREYNQNLQANLAYLRLTFPKYRILEVPIPPPLFASDDDIVQELFLETVREIGAELGLPPADIMRPAANGSDRVEIASAVQRRLQELTGLPAMDTVAAQGRAVAAHSRRPLAAFLDEHADRYVRYRSYLNSLLVVGEGGERILIPRFQPRNPGEAALLSRLETAAAAAYHAARPSAQIVWIDCSAIVDNFGAIHCFATTMPRPSALGIR